MSQGQDAHRLIEHIRASQARECEGLIEAARAQAQALLQEARRSAARRLHATVMAERERIAREQALAEARIHTAERECAQQRLQGLFDRALSQLELALLARWAEPGPAARWIEALVAQAAAALPTRDWTLVRGGPCWQAHHEAAWSQAVAACGARTASVEQVADLHAGLRIRAQGVVLDATLATLLADRHLREALLEALDTTATTDAT